MSKAIVSVRKVVRPVSQEVRAYRIIAVIPNKAKWNQRQKRYTTSFHPRYIITESSDYPTSRKPKLPEILKFVKELKEWHKIVYVEYE